MAPAQPDSLSTVLRADFRANAPGLPDRPTASELAAALARNVLTVRFLAVLLLRLAQAAAQTFGPAGQVIKQLNHVITGADLSATSQIGPGLLLYHPTGVVIGPGCVVGARARIMQGVTIGSDAVVAGEDKGRSPTIGEDVFIGPGAVIVGNVRLGNRVEVGANSFVRSSFEDDALVAGAPAKLIRDDVRVDTVRGAG